MLKKERLYLVDGSALFYRSYFAFIRNPLTNLKGENTSAAFGVASSLIRLLKEKKPDYLAVLFDRPEPTFRHQLFEAYKANRPEMPEEMVRLIPRVKEVIAALHIPLVELPGYEADDIMGTLCKHAVKEKVDVFLVTSDKDMMQLVNSEVKILKPAIAGKDEEIIDEKAVEEKWGLRPDQIIDLLALMGDSSDNIPGVPGIGPKTAQALLKQFQSIDNLVQSLPMIKQDSLRKKIEENLKTMELSKKLATIDCEVPIDLDFRQWKPKLHSDEKLRHLFTELDFRSLLKMLDEIPEIQPEKETASQKTVQKTYILIRTFEELDRLTQKLKKQKWIAFDTETTNINPLLADLVGCSFSFHNHEAYYVPAFFSERPEFPAPVKVPRAGQQTSILDIPESSVVKKNWKEDPELIQILNRIRSILENESIGKIGQNIKYDMLVMSNYGIVVRGVEFDTMIASYLLSPGGREHNIDDLSEEHLSYTKITTRELIGSGKNQITMDRVDIEKVANYACEDADVAFQLKQVLDPKLKENGLWKLFEEVEIPLITVLMRMERSGVRIDIQFLKGMSRNLDGQMKQIEETIYEMAKEKFNINSSQQLGAILFEKLRVHETAGINKPRKTKTGQYATDVGVLENLAIHPLPKTILDYRQLAKLKSTYVDALPELVNPQTGRVHTSYNQAVAATGRLSSADPNLQNIPIRTEQGREIRKAFIPGDPTRVIISADYSQVELRILAHVTGDKNLIQAFQNDEDIHLSTAAKIFGVSHENVTKQMRSDAKAINFGIIYGMEAFGLSRRTGMTTTESRAFIDNYFKLYPGVREFIENTKVKAKKNGFVTTLLKRRRYLPELQSKDQNIRKFGERTAINTVIQGTAADLIKLAMIHVDRWIRHNHYETLMILQVHDELVFDTPKKEFENVKKNIKLLMESALPEITVPLKVDIGVGNNWFEAH